MYLNTHNSYFDIIVLSETCLINDFKLNLHGYQTTYSYGTLNIKDNIIMITAILTNYNSLELTFKCMINNKC